MCETASDPAGHAKIAHLKLHESHHSRHRDAKKPRARVPWRLDGEPTGPQSLADHHSRKVNARYFEEIVESRLDLVDPFPPIR
jgi:hypothetical protein